MGFHAIAPWIQELVNSITKIESIDDFDMFKSHRSLIGSRKVALTNVESFRSGYTPIGNSAPYAILATTLLAMVGGSPIAYAQGVSYTGNRYSTGTTNSTTYNNYDARSNDTLLTTRTTEATHNLTTTGTTPTTAEYFAYNVATGSAAGVRATTPGYPSGWNFSGGLVESASGAGGNVTATFTGATTGTDTKPFATDTWIKGGTESNGAWNVLANQASILGGYTNTNMQGKLTIDLGSSLYTSWGSLIGTGIGATLNVNISAYNTASPATAIFSYDATGITHSTANPTFTGFTTTTGFNRIVITALKTSTTAGNATYPGYPNAAFIALDQVEVGQFQPVPAPPAAVSLAIGGMVGMVCTGVKRVRRKNRKA